MNLLSTIIYAVGFGLLGYLSGSLTPSIWITRMVKGVDVRAGGSGHATTTNTIRQAGFGPGALVFILDVAKGFLPTWLAFKYAPQPSEWIVTFTAVLVVIGHCWPIFAGFRGGMGLAPAWGSFLAVQPVLALYGVVLMIALLLIVRHAARATVALGILIAPILWLLGQRGLTIWMGIGIGLIISLRFLIDWNRKYRELWLDREKPSKDNSQG